MMMSPLIPATIDNVTIVLPLDTRPPARASMAYGRSNLGGYFQPLKTPIVRLGEEPFLGRTPRT